MLLKLFNPKREKGQEILFEFWSNERIFFYLSIWVICVINCAEWPVEMNEISWSMYHISISIRLGDSMDSIWMGIARIVVQTHRCIGKCHAWNQSTDAKSVNVYSEPFKHIELVKHNNNRSGSMRCVVAVIIMCLPSHSSVWFSLYWYTLPLLMQGVDYSLVKWV